MIPEEDELPLEDEKLLFDEEDLLSAEADTAYEEAVKPKRSNKKAALLPTAEEMKGKIYPFLFAYTKNSQ